MQSKYRGSKTFNFISMFTLFLFLNIVVVHTLENDAWKLEIALSKLVEDYLFHNEYTRQAESEEDYGKLRITISGPGVTALQEVLQMAARKSIQRPGVEVGPGVFKNKIVQYPPNKFMDDLKKLLKLKEKMEQNNTN